MTSSKSSRFEGIYSHFDAKLIILQIISLQFSFYLGLTLIMLFLDLCFGLRFHKGQIFDFSIFDLEHNYGLISYLSYFLNTGVLYIALIYIVVKANKVLDFVTTIYFYHFIICALFNGIDSFRWNWLIVNLLFMGFQILTGEFICLKLEQQEIKLLDTLFTVVTNAPSKKSDKRQYMEMKEVITL